jgi:hypothetical protein
MTTKREFHRDAKHSPSIADILDGVIKYGEQKNVIDGFNRVWEVKTHHSGFILTGLNHNGFVPYWSSYKIGLPDLRLFDGSVYPECIPEEITLKSVIEQVPDPDGARFVDDAGIVWEAKFAEHTGGYEIANVYDNAWFPWCTCCVIGLPGFRLLRTKEQSQAIQKEFSING